MKPITPDYYRRNGLEVFDFIEAFNLNFNLGNVAKYIARAGNKAGEVRLTALVKAAMYLQREISTEEDKITKRLERIQ